MRFSRTGVANASPQTWTSSFLETRPRANDTVGKVWSLFHKGMKKQLFFNNPAHQPANIGYLKAWSSGGAEWNWAPGKIGHLFTERPVDVVPTRLGLWCAEYNGLNGTVWQVDMLLVNETFYVHPKITNPHPVELPGYWWTCVAMPVDSPLTRVIIHEPLGERQRLRAVAQRRAGRRKLLLPRPRYQWLRRRPPRPWHAWQDDLSFLGNIPHANDFFMHIDKGQQPWIAHSRVTAGQSHSHPDKLNGTKFFQWGYNEFGMFNEDFLGDGNGRPRVRMLRPLLCEHDAPGPIHGATGRARADADAHIPLPAARNDAAVDDDTTGDGATVRTRHGLREWTEGSKLSRPTLKTCSTQTTPCPLTRLARGSSARTAS